jgi:TonB-dependent starch-binding outer membrane protein SusC
MKRRFFSILSFLLLGILITAAVNAQGIRVSGKVTDATDGSPLAGVTVQEKGTTNGTATDIGGNYVLTVAPTATLLVSYVGYTTLEIPVNNQTSLNIRMEVGELRLQEVMVIGYGTVRKEDATGSVKAVSSEYFNPGIVASPQEMVIGKMAGVQIINGGGAPGAGSTIRIRGGSSLRASNDPLIVIDGVAVDTEGPSGMRNPLSAINSNDIETFTVLKDASATAIYGSRASNGVILITTKKGVAGKPFTANYTGSISVSRPIRYVDVFSASEFKSLINTKYASNPAANLLLGSMSTDWQKEIYRDAVSTDHNLNFSGGTGNLPYRFSMGYTNQNGILKSDNLERVTGALNVSPSFLSNHLKVEINAKGMSNNNVFANQGAIGGALSMDPTQATDFIWKNPDGSPLFVAPMNPLVQLEDYNDVSTVNRFIGNMMIDYKFHFLPALSAKLNLGLDRSASTGAIGIPVGSFLGYSTYHGTGRDTEYDQHKKNSLLDFYFDYSNTFLTHSRINVVAGYSWQHFYRDGKTYTTSIGGETIYDDSDYKSENYLVSVFGRVNYVLRDKYMLTFTLRDDGSSRFAPENRWGLFPSAAFAWNISKENFLAGTGSTLSNLKLRLGYGITGQQNLSDNDYPYQAIYTYSDPGASYLFGDRYIQTARAGGYDANLKWEETTTYNIGLDYGFLNDRITGDLDFYKRETADLINQIPVPAGTNLTNQIVTNVGDLENRGFEFSINAKAITRPDLDWEFGFNASWQENKITKLTAIDDPNYKGVFVGGISGGVGNTMQIHSVGYPSYSFYVQEQVYNPDGSPIEGLYVDRNKDGAITGDDRYIYQKPAATVFMGFTSMLRYKAFDFTFNGRVNLGNYIYNNVFSNGSFANMAASGYLSNRVTNVNETKFENSQYFSDYYIENGSFMKLDNMALGYNLSGIMADRMDLRFNLSIQNLFTITKYTGLDPEVFSGIDSNTYPRPRTFMLGISLTY